MRILLLLLASATAFAAEPGKFDYYLLSISWSPDFCAGHQTAPECGGTKRYAFVVHGLWPQYEKGFPSACGGAPFQASQVPATVNEIMPSQSLQRHEWTTHGTCSGLQEREYFQTIERAFRTVTIPEAYRQPLKQIEIAPDSIRTSFAQSNASFPPGSFVTQCSGRYLSEVRVCLDKGLRPRTCSSFVKNTCRTGTVIMRPVR